MPRPIKQGLDYFPIDVDFFQNKKINTNAKKMLFDIADNAIINIDDEAGKRYLSEIPCPAKITQPNRHNTPRYKNLLSPNKESGRLHKTKKMIYPIISKIVDTFIKSFLLYFDVSTGNKN